MGQGGYQGWRSKCGTFAVLTVFFGSLLTVAQAQQAPAGGEKQPPAAEGNQEKPAAAPQQAQQVPAPPNAAPPKIRPLPGQIQMRGVVVPQIRRNIVGGAEPGAGDDEPIFFPADRATLQRLSKARELLESKRYGEAVRLLGDILEGPEDFFFQPNREEPIHRSLKSEAQRLIGELPTEGGASYELQYGAQARQQLDTAVASRSTAALAEVSRRFFHTQAGYEATYILANDQFIHGHPMAAALSYKRLLGTPWAERFEPNLSVKAAICWAQAGMSDKAREVLEQIPAERRAAGVSLLGKSVPLFRRNEESLAWLEQTAGTRPGKRFEVNDQWTMYRGGASRNTQTHGSSPLLSRRWAIPTSDVFGKPVETLVKQLQTSAQDQGNVLLCSLHPLAVNDVVFMRTVGGLLAVNFSTGKRLWPGPVDESIRQLLEPSVAANAANQPGRLGNARNRNAAGTSLGPQWLSQRLWEDATYGTMSSDGERIFCVEELDQGMGPAESRTIVQPNGRRVPQIAAPRTYNRLAAYDIATEGKLKWEAGGPPGAPEVELSGVYFLGPPLPLADRVYSLVEVKGEIRLVALDAATGKVDWSQQLAVLDTEAGSEQPRRMAGVSPSYADGVIVCPTAAGAVVALDLTTRSLLWGYQYSRQDGHPQENLRLGMIRNQPIPGMNAGNTGRWSDSSVTIAGGRVLVTPPESNQLHCLNLLDGKLLWQQPREDGLYVGCVTSDRVVVIGRNGVRALSLESGDSVWPEATLPFPVGSVPSGRGFFNGERYHVPLSSAEVAAIDVATGQIVSRAKSRNGFVPGNLICYRGAVISQNVDVIERFDQRDDLWEQINAAIATNPDNAQALARRGELLLDDGDFLTAIESLRRSYTLDGDPRTRELLVDALLEGLRADFAAHRNELPEIEKLIDQPQQLDTYLRLVAAGLQQSGDAPGAFAAYSRIAGLETGSDVVQRIDHSLSVRRDRWVQARLKELIDSANSAEREAIEKTIAARLAAAQETAGTGALRNFLAFYAPLPIANQARTEFANRLITEGSLAEAEQVLRPLENVADLKQAGEATAKYASLLTTARRPNEAAIYYRRLADRFADVDCTAGKTGTQLVAELPERSDIRLHMKPTDDWPVGVVERSESKGQNGALSRHFALALTGDVAPFYEHASVCVDQQQQALTGLDGFGRERWRVPLRDPNQNNQNTFFGNGQMNPVRVSGHLVLVSLGYQVLAIDTLGVPGNEGARVLWRHDLIERAPNMPFQPQPHVVQVPWAVPRVVVADPLGRPLGNIGPITPDFACYQRMRSVIAVRPLTGESLWVRNDTEPGSDIFGDDELLFIVPPNSEDALVVRAIDGVEVGRRRVAASNQRMTTVGRRLASWTLRDGMAILKFTDPWKEQDLWERRFEANAKAWVVNDEAIGVMTHDGNFVLLSLADGKALVEDKVSAEPQLSEIYVLSGPDHYVLATSHPNQVSNRINRQPVTAGIGNPLLTGQVYFYDRHTGKRIGSTRVDRHGLSLSQPASLPVLVLATHVYDQRNKRSQNVEAEVVFIDKRTARIVHEEKLQQPLQQGLDLVGDPENHQLILKTQGGAVNLTFTGKPLPPVEAPDALSGTATAQEAGKAVLRGLQNWFQSVTPPLVPAPQGDK